ncbi:MAG: PrgI family protein [Patescibacteria group bacterium]|nr:PrgI family protein [Patescibacteria group bacterium]
MQQFTVPQFLDIEDKIIGPITVRQFLILLFAFMLIALSYRFLTFITFLVVGVIIFCVSGIFAFLKVNGMPFHYFILNLLQSVKRPGTRVWNNEFQKYLIGTDEKVVVESNPIAVKEERLNTSRLAELSLMVDTQGSYGGEDGNETVITTTKEKGT